MKLPKNFLEGIDDNVGTLRELADDEGLAYSELWQQLYDDDEGEAFDGNTMAAWGYVLATADCLGTEPEPLVDEWKIGELNGHEIATSTKTNKLKVIK